VTSCPSGCDIVGIRACFSTQALIGLFAAAASPASHDPHQAVTLPCVLLDARIVATLTSGDTVAAVFEGVERHDGDGDAGGRGRGDLLGHGGEAALRPRVTPNPLNPGTMLSFSIQQRGLVHVAVYDMQGRLVKRMVDGYRLEGEQAVAWDGTNESNQRVPRGVYFFRIQAPEGSITRRVAVLK